jgi:hypothetical protein
MLLVPFRLHEFEFNLPVLFIYAGQPFQIPLLFEGNMLLDNNELFIRHNCQRMREKAQIGIEETFCVDTRIYFCCICGSHCSIRPDLLVSSQVKINNCRPGKALAICVNSADFEVNHGVVLVEQLQRSGNMVKRKDLFYPE